MHCEFISHIDEIEPDEWNRLAGNHYPFLQHAFLAALERSGSVGERSGWTPHHLLIRDRRAGRLLAALPAYLKSHSYGEYVFDWGWADAYHRNGLDYYPKLLTAIPFTPCSGPRLLINPDIDPDCVIDPMLDALASELDRGECSSWHLLFPKTDLAEQLAGRGLLQRFGVQYHWHNRDYHSFDDFLALMSSRKRKNIRRERRQIEDQGVQLKTLRGREITDAHWEQFFTFYQMTYAKRSGHGGYLNRSFFSELAAGMPDALMLVMAEYNNQPVGGAFYLVGQNTLYGRYWGCVESFSQLHFEACYYRGIDYCIEQGLQVFDAGAQGEHKLARGFEPVITRSCHLIRDPRFRAAIDDFLQRETPAIIRYHDDAIDALPYRDEVLASLR